MSDQVLVCGILGIVILTVAVVSDNKDKFRHGPEISEKTQYMELCADEGISPFHCYDNWLRIKYNDN